MNAKIKSLAILMASALFAGAAVAAEEGETPHYPLKKPNNYEWSFSGPLGTYDKEQLQRGFQVYREVCASCHSLDLVAFRTLAEHGGPGFSEDVVKALAAEYQITDGPNEEGDMFERPGIPSDRFPAPFANEEAAKASNNGAAPPDFSLIAKARAPERGFPTFVADIFTQYQESGPDYITSLLTGYTGTEPNEGGTYDNPYFVGGASLAMAPPLSDELVDYEQEGIPETTEQYAKDVSAFLMWAAEPHLEQRKAMGFSVMLFLIVFAGLLYFTKKKVWSDVEH
jgi:ubiquinol-cytochrome c reductase cytochrome c1 subunit